MIPIQLIIGISRTYCRANTDIRSSIAWYAAVLCDGRVEEEENWEEYFEREREKNP